MVLIRRRPPGITGKSSAPASNIWAARKVFKKAVFCIDNVHLACNEEDMRSYVTSQGIEVFSCFTTDPRRRRNETIEDVQDRKAFRLCINAADCERLLDPNTWPDSIRVSEWFFRNKNNQPTNGGERRVRQRIYSPDTLAPLTTGTRMNSGRSDDVITDVRRHDNEDDPRCTAAVVTAVTDVAATDTATTADVTSDSMDTVVAENTTESDKDNDCDNERETTTIYNHGQY